MGRREGRKGELPEFYKAFYKLNGRLGREYGIPARIAVVFRPDDLMAHLLRHIWVGHLSNVIVQLSGILDSPPLDLPEPKVRFEPSKTGAEPYMVDRIVIELDFKKPLVEELDWVKDVIWDWQMHGIVPVVVFSGHKSLHLHFVFREPLLIEFEDFYAKFAEAFFNRLYGLIDDRGLKMRLKHRVDMMVLKDIRHLCRMPYTLNEKSGFLSCVLDPVTFRPLSPRDAMSSLTYVPDDVLRPILMAVRVSRALRRELPKRPRIQGGNNSYYYIRKVLEASGIPDGRKRLLYHWIIPYLVMTQCREAKTADECVNIVMPIVKEWINRQNGHGKIYDSWIRNEIRYCYDDKLRPWSLRKVCELYKNDVEFMRVLKSIGIECHE